MCGPAALLHPRPGQGLSVWQAVIPVGPASRGVKPYAPVRAQRDTQPAQPAVSPGLIAVLVDDGHNIHALQHRSSGCGALAGLAQFPMLAAHLCRRLHAHSLHSTPACTALGPPIKAHCRA
jgi:hypothetical protein